MQTKQTDSYSKQFNFLMFQLMNSIIRGYIRTIPYIYKNLPSYNILSLFNAAFLPWSLKFILSPLLEKYYVKQIGKRKFWILLSLAIISILLIAGSFLTSQQQILPFVIILLFIQIFATIQSNCVQGLAIKQFYQIQKVGILQTIGSYGGIIIGSVLVMKVTSQQFSSQIGLTHSIGTLSEILIFTSIILIVFTVYIYFTLQQRQLQCQNVGRQKSLGEIVCYYGLMFNLKSKYCRLAIFIFFAAQGFNFFHAGYQYQLVKHGFSRDLSNSIWALICIPLIILTFFTDRIMQAFTHYRLLTSSMIVTIILYIAFLFWNPLDTLGVAVEFLGVQIPYALRTVVIYYLVNSLPLHGYSGMFVNLLISLWYLSESTAVHSFIIGYTDFKWASLCGILYQIIMVPFLPTIYKWIQQGQVNVQQQMLEQKYQSLEQY